MRHQWRVLEYFPKIQDFIPPQTGLLRSMLRPLNLGPGGRSYNAQISHLHCHDHSCPYSDADNIGSNCGTFGIIYSCSPDANGDQCVTVPSRSPQAKADCKSASRAGSPDPWLIDLSFIEAMNHKKRVMSWDTLQVDLVHSDDCYCLPIPPLFQSDLVCLLSG